jgi:peptidyl-prolyl cis-trans isomerase D
MPQAMVDAIFALDTTAGNNTSVVTLTSGNIGVVKLNAVNAASVDSIDEAVKESTQQSIANSQGQQTYQNFIDALRDSADVQLVAQ